MRETTQRTLGDVRSQADDRATNAAQGLCDLSMHARHAVEKLADAAPDLRSKIDEASQELTSSVKEHASEAAEEIHTTVTDSAAAVKAAATDNGS